MIDHLDTVVIPVAIALLPFLWAGITWWLRRWQFRNLILREIEEISPIPDDIVEAERKPGRAPTWTDYQPPSDRFIHCDILGKPTENRDFILSLPPTLVYSVNQLWKSSDNPSQWLYMLMEIRDQVPWWRFAQAEELDKNIVKWHKLMRKHNVSIRTDIKTDIEKIETDIEKPKRPERQA